MKKPPLFVTLGAVLGLVTFALPRPASAVSEDDYYKEYRKLLELQSKGRADPAAQAESEAQRAKITKIKSELEFKASRQRLSEGADGKLIDENGAAQFDAKITKLEDQIGDLSRKPEAQSELADKKSELAKLKGERQRVRESSASVLEGQVRRDFQRDEIKRLESLRDKWTEEADAASGEEKEEILQKLVVNEDELAILKRSGAEQSEVAVTGSGKAETRDERIARLNRQAEEAVTQKVFRKDSAHKNALQHCSSLYLNARYDKLTATRKMDDFRIARVPVCYDPDNAACGVKVRDDLSRFLLKQSKEGGCLKDRRKVKSLGRANGYDIVNDRKEATTVGQANFQADLYDTLFRAVTVATTESMEPVAGIRNGVLEVLIPEVSLKNCPKSAAVAAAVADALRSAEKRDSSLSAAVDCLESSTAKATSSSGEGSVSAAVSDTTGAPKEAALDAAKAAPSTGSAPSSASTAPAPGSATAETIGGDGTKTAPAAPSAGSKGAVSTEPAARTPKALPAMPRDAKGRTRIAPSEALPPQSTKQKSKPGPLKKPKVGSAEFFEGN